ncbi:CopG family transcriptional regulator [Brevibacillus borstelensis]|uniref:ribbon-helix-helix domain-containing protein n=1 Tax=Brevibacillus borstelensis TaxID=45462 RepID=UPI002E1F34CC|nr:ribbon-helix-helix domain-containing protein [Brevibacillus borstelensis]
MFPRRKRNWDLSGANNRIKQDGATHGIDWGVDRTFSASSDEDHTECGELESGWEEENEQSFSPVQENFIPHRRKGQSELAYSERQREKNGDFRQHDTSFSGLQKRPDFYEQHKKLTIYMEKELLETIERLKKGRYIPSYSWLVSEAVKQYLAVQK